MADEVIYNVPHKEEHQAQQNWERGKIAGYKEILELAEDLKAWKENK